MEGIGNSRGVGWGSNAQENPEEKGGGGDQIKQFPEGQLTFIPMYAGV